MKKPQKQPASQQLLFDSPPADTNYFENRFRDQGHIAGVDEAGRGPLAGPVVAASVILPKDLKIPGLKDSKQLTEKQRDGFYEIIKEKALAFAVGIVEPWEIDRINILKASLKAMQISVSKLKVKPSLLFIDGPYAIESRLPQKTLKKGDARSITIAAASVIAKVTRDRMMIDFERRYPNFSFSVHKGYGTELHLKELKKHGPTPIHRMTFAPVSSLRA